MLWRTYAVINQTTVLLEAPKLQLVYDSLFNTGFTSYLQYYVLIEERERNGKVCLLEIQCARTESVWTLSERADGISTCCQYSLGANMKNDFVLALNRSFK